MPSSYFVTARNDSAAADASPRTAPALVALAPAMLADMQCRTAGTTMNPWQGVGLSLMAASLYQEAYRRALALVAERRAAERRAGKIVFATARNH